MTAEEESAPERPDEKVPEQEPPPGFEMDEAVREWEAAHLEIVRRALEELEERPEERAEIVSRSEEAMYDLEGTAGPAHAALPSRNRYLRVLYDVTGYYGTVSVLVEEEEAEAIDELMEEETWLAPTSMEYPSVIRWKSLYLVDGSADFRERAMEALRELAPGMEALPVSVRVYPLPRGTTFDERPFCTLCDGAPDFVLEARNLGPEPVEIPAVRPGSGWRVTVRRDEEDEPLKRAEPADGDGGEAHSLEPGEVRREAVPWEALLAQDPEPGAWEVDAVLSLSEDTDLVAATGWARRVRIAE